MQTQTIDNILDELDVLLPENKNITINADENKDEELFSASIDFRCSDEANQFAVDYSRKTKRGHTVFKSKVEIYGLTKDDKQWVDNYINNLNSQKRA